MSPEHPLAIARRDAGYWLCPGGKRRSDLWIAPTHAGQRLVLVYHGDLDRHGNTTAVAEVRAVARASARGRLTWYVDGRYDVIAYNVINTPSLIAVAVLA